MNPDLEKDYNYHRLQCEKLSKEIMKAKSKPLKHVMELSVRFIPSAERELLQEITHSKETTEVFLSHLRTIYAAELQKRRDEYEAIRAANPLPPIRVMTREESDAEMAKHSPLLYKRMMRRRALLGE